MLAALTSGHRAQIIDRDSHVQSRKTSFYNEALFWSYSQKLSFSNVANVLYRHMQLGFDVCLSAISKSI